MATTRYSLNAGQTEFQVTQAVGAATVTGIFEFTVDTGTASVTDASSNPNPRAPKREEALLALEMFQNWILEHTWPGA